MQNQQMAAMAGMNAQMGGPVEGTPIMGNMPHPTAENPRNLMNTYIYDYFLRNNHFRLARCMIDSDIKVNLDHSTKRSPGSRNVNGVDGMDPEEKDLPLPALPSEQCVENSFLMDWWCQFWDIYGAARERNRNQGKPASVSGQYSANVRSLAHMSNEQRNQRLMMNGMNGMNGMNQAQFNMMRNMPNGAGDPNGLKRAAMNNQNRGANPMANPGMMKNQAIMSAQMQRDGSGMEMNGQRPQSPGSAENAPSPNKRQRVEGAMNAANMGGNGFNEFAQQGQNVQQKSIEGMNPGVQGSPMNHPSQGLEGQNEILALNPQGRPGGMPAAPGQGQGNHALQDYQMQLMLLEQQNKKRLLMARQEQDSMSGGPHNGQGGGPGFPPAMSPQGSRAGPSPNPTDQMKRGTPKLNQGVLPGSPMPDAAMQQQRGSPAPGMNFDPNQMPPGMPPQYPGFAQMPGQNPMMRPPSSHPGFNGQAGLTQQQLEMMRQGGAGAMQNGFMRPGPNGMMGPVGQQQQMGGPMNQPQQRNNPMPPPPAPANEAPRTQEPSPSQPAQAPPTPSQGKKANPKKAGTKDNKKPANKKGANAGATPAASAGEEPPTPTPSTPITPMHKNSFANGQQAAQQAAQPPQAAPQPPPPMDPSGNAPFGNLEDSDMNFNLDSFGDASALGDFDFDSFLHVEDGANQFSLGNDFTFGDTAEVGGDL